MRQHNRLPLGIVLAFLLAFATGGPVLAQTGQEQHRPVHGVNSADMDLAVDPGTDFYRYANGVWLDRTEIPGDEGGYGVFDELDDETTVLLLDLMERLATGGGLQGGTDEWKAVRMFEQGTDLPTRNAQGIEPIRPILDEIDAIRDLNGFHQFMEGAGFRFLTGVFGIYASPDPMDSSVNAASLSGPFLGLPNRDYYLEDDPGNEEVRAAYREAATKLLVLAGYDPVRAETASQAVYDLERSLAEPTLSREERQDQSLSYNPTAIDDLQASYPLMDWRGFTTTLGIPDVPQLIVTEAGYLAALPGIVETAPIEALKDYLKLEVLWSFAGNLTEEIEQAAFDFQGAVLSGVTEMRPLEERALDQVNGTLGEAVGQLYVAETFPPEAKAQIEELVAALRVSFRDRLEANDWMTPETKAKAFDKLATINVKVGYPDRWKSYGAVTIENSYAETALSAYNTEYRRNLRQVGQPVDEDEWFMTPQTVNAYYNPFGNEIVFPAAILQPPFFNYRADPASNFGGIGFVIAHEITHGFDLQGSQFDENGNLNNWWTDADNERFQALNDRAVEQFNGLEVLPSVFVDGQITVTENVADMGGVQVAYQALGDYLAEHGQPLPPPPILGTAAQDAAARPVPLTQQQRFFVSAATVWREKIRDEALQTQVNVDPHAPAAIRATQPIRNMDAFFDAFDIEPGDPLYLPPEERVVIW